MEESRINWRWYLAVFRRWWWVMMMPVVPAGALAYALTAAQPPLFRATARVTIVPPIYLLNLTDYQFATNVDPVFDSRDYTAAANQAISERVLERLAESEAASSLPEAKRDANSLREFLTVRVGSARVGSDPDLLNLIVTDTEPQRAADLANAWAAIFAEEAAASTISGAAVAVDVETPAAAARAGLDAADAALRDFAAASPIPVLTEKLAATIRNHNAFLNAAAILALLRQENPPITSGSVTVQLAATTLSLTIPTGVDEGTIAARAAILDDWISRFTAAAQELEPKIAELQSQLAEAQLQEVQLQRARDAALEYSNLLDTKRREQELEAALGENQIVRIRGEAAVPRNPVATREVLNAELAALVGLGLGVLLAFALALLRKPQPTGTRV